MGQPTFYDVIEIDWDRSRSMIASRLAREVAVALARDEARTRRLGRMFLEGSNGARGVGRACRRPARPGRPTSPGTDEIVEFIQAEAGIPFEGFIGSAGSRFLAACVGGSP